jgi:hypothetical protein
MWLFVTWNSYQARSSGRVLWHNCEHQPPKEGEANFGRKRKLKRINKEDPGIDP